MGPKEPVLATVKRQKLTWIGHVTPRQPLQNHLSGHFLFFFGGGGEERRGRKWMDNVKQWTSLPMSDLLTRPPAGMTGRGYLLNFPSSSTDDPLGERIELSTFTAK